MDWNQLIKMEASWNLSSGQKAMLADSILQKAHAPRNFYFPILKPILAVAAMAVLAFGLLLLWPKKPMEEQIATIPGAGADAKPGEYIENKPAEQKNPPKEEISNKNPSHKEEISNKNPSPNQEEQLPLAGGEGEQEAGMPFSEALAIVKAKATYNNFDKTLTEEQREAFSLYLTHENYYYLQGQLEGEIGRLKESGAKEYTLELQVFTTQKYLGTNLFAHLPFGTLLEKTAVKAPNQQDNAYFAPRILGKELSSSKEYLKNLTFSNTLPDGRGTAKVSIGGAPLTMEQCQKLVDSLLAMKEVTWVELQYQVKDDTGDPTAIHRYWETQEELPFKEARAIVIEKIRKRFDQKLSDRERMAFYVVFSVRAGQSYFYAMEYEKAPSITIYSNGKNADPDSLFNIELEGATLRHLGTNQADTEAGLYYYLEVPNQEAIKKDAYNDCLGIRVSSGGSMTSCRVESTQTDCEKWVKEHETALRYMLSIDFVCAVEWEVNEPPNYGI